MLPSALAQLHLLSWNVSELNFTNLIVLLLSHVISDCQVKQGHNIVIFPSHKRCNSHLHCLDDSLEMEFQVKVETIKNHCAKKF